MKFEDYINEAVLSAPNLKRNINRIDKMELKMLNKEPFVMFDKTEVVFPLSQNNIDELEKLRNHVNGSKYRFEDENGAFHPLSHFEKTFEFGSNKSLNSKGKDLADAGERATILSLTEYIDKPEDTNEKLFIQNPDAFERWKNSFRLTKEALNTLLGTDFEKKYNIIHDATSISNFHNIITIFCKVIKTNKDSWNPADMWLISKTHQKNVEETLHNILINSSGNNKKNLINQFNSKIYELYKNKYLIPVSLKQITNNKYSIEENNVPNAIIPSYDVEIKKLICNMKMDTVEIGSFSFLNKVNKQKITFQTKGYPNSSASVQTEITSDGTKTGGRLGKVPAVIIKNVYEEYGFFKIVPSKYFEKDLKKTKDAQIKEWVKWYLYVISHKSIEYSVSKKDIDKVIRKNLNTNDVNTFKHKIQGLAMQYFLIKNEKHISSIITKYILGAKKINPVSSFFIKIY